jgi:hypothetical protein
MNREYGEGVESAEVSRRDEKAGGERESLP